VISIYLRKTLVARGKSSSREEGCDKSPATPVMDSCNLFILIGPFSSIKFVIMLFVICMHYYGGTVFFNGH